MRFVAFPFAVSVAGEVRILFPIGTLHGRSGQCAPAYRAFQKSGQPVLICRRGAHSNRFIALFQAFLKALEEALGSNSIVYEMREIRPQELSNERTLISERLASLKGKEDRIRASYREGIDTLEEYKENKALIAKERDSLERQLAELEENAPDKTPEDPTPKMLDRVSSVHDILVSDSYSLVQKNEALKQIIDKIVYDRESDTLKIHFFLYCFHDKTCRNFQYYLSDINS